MERQVETSSSNKMNEQYKLSILIPSAYPDKLERLLNNLRETMADFYSTEIVICLDGWEPTERHGNIVYCYEPPSKFRSRFFNCAWRNSTGRFVMMANDDIVMKTKNWDDMIPFEEYPDDLVLFYFKDNEFNRSFSCHPIWSRKMMSLGDDILGPDFQITKCDNTIWDTHPAVRRVYLPDIVLDHRQTPYGPEWTQAYKDDNIEYSKHQQARIDIRNKICREIGMKTKVMIGIPTAEFARRADFYDHFNQIQKPEGTICMFVHGQSIAHNRNQVIKSALEYDCTHVFFLDDDVITRPDIIFQLLSHDKDVVCALQLARNHPHRPYLFSSILDDGRFGYYRFDADAPDLVKILAAGMGAVLIKTEVFKALESPWIRYGQLDPDQLAEDLDFFKRIGILGFESFADLTCTVGHIATAVVWPTRVQGSWYVTYDTNGPTTVNFLHSEQKLREIKELETV